MIIGSHYRPLRNRNAPIAFPSTARPPFLTAAAVDRGSTPVTTDLSLAPNIAFATAVRFLFSTATTDRLSFLPAICFQSRLTFGSRSQPQLPIDLFLPVICIYYSGLDRRSTRLTTYRLLFSPAIPILFVAFSTFFNCHSPSRLPKNSFYP